MKMSAGLPEASWSGMGRKSDETGRATASPRIDGTRPYHNFMVSCEVLRNPVRSGTNQIQNFIDGQFVAPVGGKYLDNIEPATGNLIR